MELLWRSIFQDVEKDNSSDIAYCKMHDLMHDLATLVAGTKNTMLTSSEECIGEKVRHVFFDLVYLSRQPTISIAKGMKIRTILAGSVGGDLGNFTCDALVSNLKYLCALDLSCLRLCVVPCSIGELKHLRYLNLYKNNIEILPNSITKLLNLQTLILKKCLFLRELPKGINMLVSLKYLDITNCSKLTNMPLEIECLTSLEIVLP